MTKVGKFVDMISFLLPMYANIQLIKSKFPNYRPADEDWIRDTDGGWYRGVEPEVFTALMGINVRRWNKCFDRDMRTRFNREKTLLWKKARVVQKLIKDATGTDQEDVVYICISLRNSATLKKKSCN